MAFENSNGQHNSGGLVRTLLFTVCTLLLLFASSDVLVVLRIRRIDEAAMDIAKNSTPSITYLSAARADLEQTFLLLEDSIDGIAAGAAPDTSGLDQARKHFDDELSTYHELPTFPREAAMAARMERARGALDRVLDDTEAQIRRRDAAGARVSQETAVAPLGEQVGREIMRVIDLNATYAHQRAEEIGSLRHSAVVLLVALDAVSAALALVLTSLALRAVRSYEGRMQSMRRGAEDRASELDQFAVRLAHDVKGPLTAVALELQGIQKHAGEAERARGAADRARRQVRRVSQRVEGLLDFARAGAHPDSGARADPRVVLDDLLDELEAEAREARAELTIEPFPPHEVECAPSLLGVVLANLIRNALKYLGGAPERRVALRVVPRHGVSRFEVRDTGPGVPESFRAMMFEAYARAPGVQASGLGLGLATVRRIVEAHGGRAGYEPGVPSGSVFWFELPVVPEPTPARVRSEPFGLRSGRSSSAS